MVQGIDNIGMCTTNVERLVWFYRKLGFTEALFLQLSILG